MAAPTLCGSKKAKQKDKSNPKAQSNSNARKTAKKNILLPPFKLEWPDVEEDIENKILDALVLKLKEFPRLMPERKRAGAGSKDKDKVDSDDDLVRQRLKHQLAVGHREVSKQLERDQLDLVLVWREPSFLVRSLLPLAATRHCSALCLKNLMPRITEATGLSSLVALGFKKKQPGLDDFTSFVTMATPLAPSLSVPWVPDTSSTREKDLDAEETVTVKEGEEMEMNTANNSNGGQKMGEEEGTASHPVVDWPVLPADKEELLLEKLTGLLQPFNAVFKKPKPRFTSKEWKLQRKILRDCVRTNLVAIGDAARCGMLDLLLVQSDPDLPKPALTSVVMTAVKKDCPVLHLNSLRKRVTLLTRNPLLKAVGFRTPTKFSLAQRPVEFTEFIEQATEMAAPDLKALIPAQSSLSTEIKVSETTDKSAADKAGTKKKTPIPVYNVSHLYIYKKKPGEVDSTASASLLEQDQAAEGIKRRKVTPSVQTESFISLSAEEPTVQIIGRKLDGGSVTGKGDDLMVEKSSIDSFSGVMGLDTTGLPPAAPSPLFLPDPPKSKVKANLKRKLTSGAASGDFVSFKLVPTAVGTSVANPNKKKKEKKRRKR